MHPLIQEIQNAISPEQLANRLRSAGGVMLLRSLNPNGGGLSSVAPENSAARYSFVVADPFLTFRSLGSRCEITNHVARISQTQFGNPWHLLDSLMARCELLEEIDLPFPMGGCFGYWGYDLKNFVEPKLRRRAINDLELPDCHVGFYDCVVAFDHQLGKTWIVSTGLNADGSRSEMRARQRLEFWTNKLEKAGENSPPSSLEMQGAPIVSNLGRSDFLARIARAQAYIRAGDIYQVNLSHRLSTDLPIPGWTFFEKLTAISSAPFSAFLDCGDFQIASASPCSPRCAA